jgi:hypothetical protein
MTLGNRMEDFSFEVVSESKPTGGENQNKDAIRAHLNEAKAALKEKAYGDYWTAVNKAAALMGAADSEEADDEITDAINRKLGGPGT